MARRLFCEISPLAYKISTCKEQIKRVLADVCSRQRFAEFRTQERLEVLLYSHKSLIRRKLGEVDSELQDNKAVNLSIAAPKVNGIIIRPGEVFSFWRLVGACTERDGYRSGLVIKGGGTDSDIGGGMCQFTNLIHWMVLHSPLDIVEHHHHNGFDLFPDFNRQVPFGTGTSILYNYLDYRFKNNTDQAFQILVHTDDKYLCGELRCEKAPKYSYHIEVQEEFFEQIGEDFFRNTTVVRRVINRQSGDTVQLSPLIATHAKVAYSPEFIPEGKLRKAENERPS